MLRKILVPTDFSQPAEKALGYALYLARQYDAELHLLHVIVLHGEDPYNPDHHFPDVEDAREQVERQTAKQMRESVSARDTKDLVIKKAQRRNVSAGPAIVEYAQEEDIDLIVMSTHGRRGMRHLLLGSVTEEVVRLAPCPVLSVPGASKPTSELKRILAPIDFSGHSRQALSVARRIAADYGATLQVLHVLQDIIHPAFYNMGAFALRDLQPDIEERAEQALRELLSESAGPEVHAEYSIVEGHAAHAIEDFARRNETDLIVIATHGLTGLEHFMMGSVTEKIVRRASCPVLVLKVFRKEFSMT